MSRLCERPGCSEVGAAEYGMIPEDLLFWIAPISAAPSTDRRVLCLRHADAMSVPRGWMLDDRREEIPRLFVPRGNQGRASDDEPTGRRRSSAPRRASAGRVGEQLQIDGTGETERPSIDDAASGLPASGDDIDRPNSAGDRSESPEPEESDRPNTPWRPPVDDGDLDGLLEVSSPLLARAFRGTDRPRG